MEFKDPLVYRRLKDVAALVLDIDGVLTDGGIVYDEEGKLLKRFDAKDGMGLVLVQKIGIRIAWISYDTNDPARKRAHKLGIEDLFLGVSDKLKALEEFMERYKLSFPQVAYMGDDVTDLEPMKRVGISVAPADAVDAVLKVAHGVCSRYGGRGAVRELCDAILFCR